MFGPSARIFSACPARNRVLSDVSGGTETKYSAQGDALAASIVASRTQSDAA